MNLLYGRESGATDRRFGERGNCNETGWPFVGDHLLRRLVATVTGLAYWLVTTPTGALRARGVSSSRCTSSRSWTRPTRSR